MAPLDMGTSNIQRRRRGDCGRADGWSLVVLPLLKAELCRQAFAGAQFAGSRMKSGLKAAGSIDKIG